MDRAHDLEFGFKDAQFFAMVAIIPKHIPQKKKR